MNPGDLAQRLRRQEDIEALQRLKYLYCAASDDNYDADRVAALFTEDGVWDGGALGRLAGRAAIHASFSAVKSTFRLVRHVVTNPLIEIDGDDATCRWYLTLTKIGLDGAVLLYTGAYLDRCRRTSEGWRIAHLSLTMEQVKG